MARADDKATLIADILAMEPGLAPLDRSTVQQLRDLRDSMLQQQADYESAGLVDAAAGA